jgi:hypothetical protein
MEEDVGAADQPMPQASPSPPASGPLPAAELPVRSAGKAAAAAADAGPADRPQKTMLDFGAQAVDRLEKKNGQRAGRDSLQANASTGSENAPGASRSAESALRARGRTVPGKPGSPAAAPAAVEERLIPADDALPEPRAKRELLRDKSRPGLGGGAVPAPGEAGQTLGKRQSLLRQLPYVPRGERGSDRRAGYEEIVLWQPLLSTDAAGEASLRFILPDAATTFRIRVDAHGDGRIGSSENEIVSRPASR